jgi:hypothetical protein
MKQYVRLAIAVLALPVFLITGCEQHYRYPCQNPANWDSSQCQKPVCEIHRQCPEFFLKDSGQCSAKN